MYFTSGQNRAFERLMQERPGFDHYDGGGADAPEDCGTCRFYRPDWKYQFCVYAECPYQPGKLTAFAAVKITVKGADNELMSQDEIAVMDGGKCILQLRGVRPFLSEKFDITKHPRYKYLADADKKNTFDVDRFLTATRRKRQQVVTQDEIFDLYEIDLSDEDAAAE